MNKSIQMTWLMVGLQSQCRREPVVICNSAFPSLSFSGHSLHPPSSSLPSYQPHSIPYHTHYFIYCFIVLIVRKIVQAFAFAYHLIYLHMPTFSSDTFVIMGEIYLLSLIKPPWHISPLTLSLIAIFPMCLRSKFSLLDNLLSHFRHD